MTFWLETGPDIAFQIERRLFEHGYHVYTLVASETGTDVAVLTSVLNDAGIIALISGHSDSEVLDRVRQQVGPARLRILSDPTGKAAEALADSIGRIIETQRLARPAAAWIDELAEKVAD